MRRLSGRSHETPWRPGRWFATLIDDAASCAPAVRHSGPHLPFACSILLALALLSALAACGEKCRGIACGACAPPITVVVDVEGAAVTAVSSAPSEALTCWSSAGTTNCQSSISLGPGTYAYDIVAAGRTKSISVVVGPGTDACCDCGYQPASDRVVFRDDDGG